MFVRVHSMWKCIADKDCPDPPEPGFDGYSKLCHLHLSDDTNALGFYDHGEGCWKFDLCHILDVLAWHEFPGTPDKELLERGKKYWDKDYGDLF